MRSVKGYCRPIDVAMENHAKHIGVDVSPVFNLAIHLHSLI